MRDIQLFIERIPTDAVNQILPVEKEQREALDRSSSSEWRARNYFWSQPLIPVAYLELPPPPPVTCFRVHSESYGTYISTTSTQLPSYRLNRCACHESTPTAQEGSLFDTKKMSSPQSLNKGAGLLQRPESSNSNSKNHHLLSPVAYDDDAQSLHSSRSEQDTDSEDDEVLARARNSQELRARDRLVLMEDEEIDRLVADTRAKKQQERIRRGSSNLAIPNPLSILRRSNSSGRRSRSTSPMEMDATGSADDLVADHGEKRKQRRARRKEKKDRLLHDARNGEDAGLMYEMESGAIKEGSSTGESSDREDSDELDRRHLNMHSKTDKKRRWKRWLFLYALIAVGFAFLVLLAWKISVDKKRETQKYVSNGTALFAPTSIIISLDGFRADFLQRGLTPRLNAFVREGVSPLYMLPSFPSVTFPVSSHHTIANLL